jgi:hypothetical protein
LDARQAGTMIVDLAAVLARSANRISDASSWAEEALRVPDGDGGLGSRSELALGLSDRPLSRQHHHRSAYCVAQGLVCCWGML